MHISTLNPSALQASPPSTVGKNIEKRDKQEEKEEMLHTGIL